MADSVPVSDVVCVDDMGKARVMEPVLADKVANLKDQCAEFMNDIELYRESVDTFIGVMDHLAKQVEREKRDAIVVSNKLASLPNKTEEEIAKLQVTAWAGSQIEQKTTELERYKIEHRSLQKIESDQTDLINRLSFQS
ncbi:intraflagellar transport protein 20 homolog isoform X1 [Melanaphis sacchari]|uniref:intraflagellar transport protein 20 homolog isoform X1 n=1 Tax=Melanaphis sacchari TaxID=742174 RepID=UPI000DC159D1|nr:intraflagellar transport protein 20 homolog isoform X1 [Melanaphis sacchari]XP_025193906.1 intraflagellar transport protein 20 homolog isoform X1 [Melanaphis sacchari]XP_025193908.1 intraflagellar transport protein 20 homolog isoform X1 [Melanaphis sacchari]XP_025193909.1 intraflagellar transport protein 20 homolog isoform X1 [Melanaphis sacchari]